MRPSIPVRQLRGRDPVTVEIEVNALSAKPLGQIAIANVADLFALEEKSDLPAGLRVRLKGFRERIARAIGDLPNGQPFAELIEAVRELPPDRVPQSMREVFAAEASNTRRTDRERAALASLPEHWEAHAPEPFEMAAPRPVQRAPAAPAREERARRTPTSRRDRPSRAAPARADADPQRTAWLKQVVLERLARALDQGLAEAVVVAGVSHRARDRYPDLTPQEILAVLRQLGTEGRARHSAGRWKLPASSRF